MTRSVRLAVLGAGLIGKRHIEHVQAEPEAELMAIVDPSSTGKALAEELGVRWAPSFSALIETDRPDGIIIATPNQVHVANGLESVAAGIPALVEKPIADDVELSTEARGSGRDCGRASPGRPSSSPQSAHPEGEGNDRVRPAGPDPGGSRHLLVL